ncbi:hypothetical protein EOK75_17710 (plasmid) [Pseudorhodobacter turbinis]|uniref:Uncharacterized protein n=1 Tax=Pseudorhodobacter turbinis TaxID=2500533 RepID=A0A4P8EL72_9RHOB|nr:hypothetical protein [Pseudorhodobacter turbinis]QCO57545.1 hypothetical protein EOK75_17710 [Pseudorhodobacter turbinis]
MKTIIFFIVLSGPIGFLVTGFLEMQTDTVTTFGVGLATCALAWVLFRVMMAWMMALIILGAAIGAFVIWM